MEKDKSEDRRRWIEYVTEWIGLKIKEVVWITKDQASMT